MSDVELNSIVNEVLDEIVDNVVSKNEKVYQKNLKYIKLNERQNIFVIIQNFIFYIMLQLELIIYSKTYDIEIVYTDKENNMCYQKSLLVCTDKSFSIGNHSTNYEYIKLIQMYQNKIILNFQAQYLTGAT